MNGDFSQMCVDYSIGISGNGYPYAIDLAATIAAAQDTAVRDSVYKAATFSAAVCIR